MANITFVVGNGLDLSLGLRTSYRDFYEYIDSSHLHPDNRIYKAIRESPETWADFERELGQYTNYIEKLAEKSRKQESNKFHEELEELREDLARYLESQERSTGDSLDSLEFTPASCYEELPSGQADRIRNLLAKRPTDIQFVTLNYTKILEKILSGSRTLLAARGIRLGHPHHIHGDLQENLTLGVSDETQLSTGMSGAEKDDLIKPTLIYSMNDGRIDLLRQMINRSALIVLFGTSLGETDKYLWEIINIWLANAADRYIIIHKHDDLYSDRTRLSSRRQKQFISNVQDKILLYSGLDGDGITALKNRIFVIHNTKRLFAANSG